MASLKDVSVYEKRILEPTIISTKENLLTALRAGSIKTSKYNLLNEEEKLFVELVAFGEYSPEAAISSIHEGIGTYAATYARRLMSKKEIIDTLDELTDIKDKSFRASLARSRDLALKRVEYIMKTSNDENIQLQAAKIILDKSNEFTKMKTDSDTPVGGIRINIAVDNVSIDKSGSDTIIPIDADAIEEEYKSKGLPIPSKDKSAPKNVNPDTGLPYVISYEGVNSYDVEKEDEDDDK